MSTLIQKLKLKPQPEVKKQFAVGIVKQTKPKKIEGDEPTEIPDIENVEPIEDEEGEGVEETKDDVREEKPSGVTIIDRRKTGYNRADLLKRLRQKGLVVPTIAASKPTEVSKPKKSFKKPKAVTSDKEDGADDDGHRPHHDTPPGPAGHLQGGRRQARELPVDGARRRLAHRQRAHQPVRPVPVGGADRAGHQRLGD